MIAARLGDRKTAETLVLVKADILMEDNVSQHSALCPFKVGNCLAGEERCLLQYLFSSYLNMCITSLLVRLRFRVSLPLRLTLFITFSSHLYLSRDM